jgi:hypothetical protein
MPEIPGTEDWSTWSYAQGLTALTGDKAAADLWHLTWTPTNGLATPENGVGVAKPSSTPPSAQSGVKIEEVKWFMFDTAAKDATLNDDKPADRVVPQDLAYYAWEKQYFGVNIDRNAIAAYEKTFDDTNVFMTDLLSLKHLDLDAYTLGDLRNNIIELQLVTGNEADQYRQMANALKSDDSAFRGKAAALIQERLEYHARALQDWHDQAKSTHGMDPANAVMDAWNQIVGMVNALYKAFEAAYNANVRSLVRNAVNQIAAAVHKHLWDSGIIAGSPNYRMPSRTVLQATNKSRSGSTWVRVDPTPEERESIIGGALSSFGMPTGGTGDLRDPATYDALNRYISGLVVTWLNTFDQAARTTLPRLSEALITLARTLKPLQDPKPFTPQAGMPNSGAGGGANSPFELNFPGLNFPEIKFPEFNFNTPGGANTPFDLNTPGSGGAAIPENLFAPIDGLFNPLNGLFDPTAGMFDSLNGLFDPTAGMFDSLNGLFDPVSSMFDGLSNNAFGGPDGPLTAGERLLSALAPFDGAAGPNGDPTGILDPATSFFRSAGPLAGALNPFPDTGGPFGNAVLRDENGQPILGPQGELLGLDGQPLLDPQGRLLGPDGQPLLDSQGRFLGPDGQPLLDLQRASLGPDGQPLLDSQGRLLGPDGQPLLDPQGRFLGPDGQPLPDLQGASLGPDGRPLLDPQGQFLGPDRQPQLGPDGGPLLGPQGELLGPDGEPLLGPDGQPLFPADGPAFSTVDGPGSPATLTPELRDLTAFDPGSPQVPPLSTPSGLAATAGAGLPGLDLGANGRAPDVVGNPGMWSVAGNDSPSTQRPGATVGPSADAAAGMGGMGGMPFCPPMGGGWGNGERKERERQTWLSEDEKVWGTDQVASLGVIGRPEDAEDEMEEEETFLPLGPVRSRRPAPERPQRPARTATSPGEEGDAVPDRG